MIIRIRPIVPSGKIADLRADPGARTRAAGGKKGTFWKHIFMENILDLDLNLFLHEAPTQLTSLMIEKRHVNGGGSQLIL